MRQSESQHKCVAYVGGRRCLVGQPGEPNKWLTLDALRVVKLFGGQT